MITVKGDALDVLKATSRTFFIPINRLPPGLLEAVASAYLCMRAIDEIEDHPHLEPAVKAELLRGMSLKLQSWDSERSAGGFWVMRASQRRLLPEVTLRVEEWLGYAPHDIAPRIWDATAAMADRMAYWAANEWAIHTEADLDCYTFSVAGAIGLLLSDLWAWYDGTQADRVYAVGFGRGLQAVNILRNRPEDLTRGVDYFPDGWEQVNVFAYARRNLALADRYTEALPPGPALAFCQIPLALAYATLDVMSQGERKLSRSAVHRLVEQVTGA
jgi:farnesyl-diphosphate farnesyltransferase